MFSGIIITLTIFESFETYFIHESKLKCEAELSLRRIETVGVVQVIVDNVGILEQRDILPLKVGPQLLEQEHAHLASETKYAQRTNVARDLGYGVYPQGHLRVGLVRRVGYLGKAPRIG